MKQIVRKSKQI